jgi:hypothetical protein
MLRITAVRMTTVPNSGENRVPLEEWLGESFWVEVALPRKTFGISVFDDMRLPHSAVITPNACFWVAELDSPNMPAPITDCFVLFHRISVSALY